ncbi:MAG: ATP-binding protein [Bacteroidia bacterium]
MSTIVHTPSRWHYTLPSDLNALNDLEAMLEKIHSEAQLPEDKLPNFLVAVIEAVSNAILHGNQKDLSKNVEVQISRFPDKVQIWVRDQGRGFDHHHLPEPTEGDYLLRESGRGIFLMRHLADSVEFLEGGRCVLLTFLD